VSRGARILVVEDDPEIVEALRRGLTGHGYDVSAAQTGQAAFTALAQRPPDVVLLDLGLPDGDGIDLVLKVRKLGALPILVISARHQETEKVKLLDAGADDYLTKPFSVSELLARIRVALRHRGTALSPAATLHDNGGLRVDLEKRLVAVDGQALHLTPTEYKLLARLVRSAGKVVTHRQLLADVWGPEYTEHTHYLRLYMGQLRAKIEQDPADPRHILTETGVGYRLAAP
jgi:two-component system KDP operon response regulator KdpE